MNKWMKAFFISAAIVGTMAGIAASALLINPLAVNAKPKPAQEEPSQEDIVEEDSLDYVALDISEGSIEISAQGYRIGDASEAVLFTGAYYITGSTEDAHSIVVLDGEHTLIWKDVVMDQRTEKDCCPLKVCKDAAVDLNLSGHNILYAGSGRSGIELESGGELNMEGYGNGSLSVLAFPDRTNGIVHGSRAVDVPTGSVINYPQGSYGDSVELYCGISRKETKQVFVYSGQTYLRIEFDVAHKEHTLSAEPSCSHGQICLLCGEEVYPAVGHTLGKILSCTEPQRCMVCGEIAAPAPGHQGVWKVTGYSANRKVRKEMLTCTVCGKVVYRNVDVEK